MKLDKRWILLLTLVLSAGLTFAACGDDPPEENNENNENNEADAGDDDADDEEDTGDADDNGGDEECTEDEDCGSGEICNIDTNECVPEETGCESDDPPARCDQTFEDTDFGPWSLIDEFAIAESDEDCCFDFDDDGENENAVASLLGLIPEDDDGNSGSEQVNGTIEENIEDDELNLLLEHDGLEDPAEDSEYDINFYLGVYENDALMIDPASLDSYDEDDGTGTYPVARIEDAEIDGDQLTAGPGILTLSLELFEGTPLSLTIQQAQIEATVDQDQSNADDGVWLTDGKLGGVVKVTDLYDQINAFAEDCGCLELDGEPLVSYDEDDLSQDTTECSLENEDANTCDENNDDESACYTLGDFCDMLPMLVQVADIDTDDDGNEDALSIGATFGTEGATVEGIGEVSAE
ncbi:MAG: hypothetical protein ACOC9J_04795 [Persicimonas sp.]